MLKPALNNKNLAAKLIKNLQANAAYHTITGKRAGTATRKSKSRRHRTLAVAAYWDNGTVLNSETTKPGTASSPTRNKGLK